MVADAAARRRISASTLVAGTLVGGAECLFFVFVLVRAPLELAALRVFGFGAVSALESVGPFLIVGAPLLAGWAFAWLLRRRGVDAAWWRTALAGPFLLLASVIGVFIAGTLEPVGIQSPDAQRLLIFRAAFVLASTTAALLCTFSVARTLGVPGALNAALLVALATGATYLLLAILVDPLPGFHVGGGERAMPRVAMVGNLLAGTVGGSLAFRLLSTQIRHTSGRP
jgi:hypothetical protein